jgi:hypothetical protein
MPFNTTTSLEPCLITAVSPEKMTATVRGLRNIGRMEVTWVDYNHIGNVGAQDSHWSGKIPEEGATALVLCEWTTGQYRNFIRGYIIGYIPPISVDALNEGYACNRHETHEPRQSGDYCITTSDRMQLTLSAGNMTFEQNPALYEKMSAEDNTHYHVSDNSFKSSGGLTEHSRSDTVTTRNVYRRIVRSHNFSKAKQDYNADEDREDYLKDNNIESTIVEEIGTIDDTFALVNGRVLTNTNLPLIYKFSVLKKGEVVYSKCIDVDGNVFEETKASKACTVGNNYFILVTELFRRVQRVIEWVAEQASSEDSGGTGAWRYLCKTVEWICNRADYTKR